MIKKLILIIALCVTSNASINDAVQNLLGASDYNTHRNLINHIFKNSSSFYKNGQIDYVKITQELSNNNLLKLDLGGTKDIEVSFSFNTNAKKSMKNINDILKAIGQQNFITQSEVVIEDQLKWTIRLKTAAAINPLRLSQELQSTNSSIVDIKREGNLKWSYFIDSTNSRVYKTEDLINNKSLSLKKPNKPYIIEISNTSAISISSNINNSWYPSIVFYDKDFKIIEIVEKDSLHKNLVIDVPNNTRYIKIDDLYSLANLKQGISITKE
ncbi:hypothetical protein N5U18_05940 [Aliarcobacter butzleri]|uniref:hypothetical protein n=1 Tax=Aliarcobacter butzleri TaxID=28197 RepID=UPI0021B18F69|nr:hypothetical protein [Aliarcobacter butzleri]MCT7548021.1 hypothetical protein [Aliarcobacter butzleri]